jgi:hypothetical protein
MLSRADICEFFDELRDHLHTALDFGHRRIPPTSLQL